MRRLVARLVEGGMDSFWWADHLMGFGSTSLWEEAEDAPDELSIHTYADPFLCMAACADVLGEAAVGTCVTDAIRRMPATLLQSALTVDHLVSGHVILGLGAGEVMNYRPYGWDVPSPAGRLEEAARSIRCLLDDPGPHEGGAVMGIRPRSQVKPSLWVAAHGPRGFSLTGKLADGWMPTNLDVDRWSTGRDAIRSAAVEAGRPVRDIQMGLSVDVVVQFDHEAAHRLLRHPAVRQICLLLPDEVFARYGIRHPLGGSALHTLIATRSADTLLSAVKAIPDELVHDQIIHGSPAEVAARIAGYPGLDHVRISDLSRNGGHRGGGVERLIATANQLRIEH